MLRDGFGERPLFRATIAEWSGAPVGFAFWFFAYSTWRGQPTLYLEDLFVRPEARGRGIGKEMMRFLARTAAGDRMRAASSGRCWTGTPRASSSTSRWEPKVVREWLTCRLEGEALRALAGR